MAHFYASAQGSRGRVHRLGGKSSGADAEVRGWHDGVRVWARFDEARGRNIYTLTFTGGSSGAFSKEIGTLEMEDLSHDGIKDHARQIVFKPTPRNLSGKDDIIIEL